MSIPERKTRLRDQLEDRFGHGGQVRFFRAPGRVDILGSHTDYNEGFIMASSIDRDVMAAGRIRDDGVLNLHSLNTDFEVRVNLDDLNYDEEHGWANYPKGVLYELLKAGVPVEGADLVFHGEVPVGGNLSSSAALEAATCTAVLGMLNHHLPVWEQIHLCRRAENEFVGMPCGILDQFTVFMAEADTALFLDCRTLQFEKLLFPAGDVLMVVIDSGVGRELVSSRYPDRRRECDEAVRILRGAHPEIKALRDVKAEVLKASRNQLPDILFRRARHVVSENERVLAARDALKERDFSRLGRLMEEGYRSSRDDYGISIPELDTLHDLCAQINGVLGTRIAGAGWGGCLVSLVERGTEEELEKIIVPAYQERFNRKATLNPVRIGPGPGEIKEEDA
jgi:galactokinase